MFRRIVRSDGLGYELGLDYFRHHVEGAAMTWDGGSPELPPLWGPAMERDLGPGSRTRRAARGAPPEHRGLPPATARGGRPRDAAASSTSETGLDDLCLAGGVALNCVVNGKIFDETPFRRRLHPAGRVRRRHERRRGLPRVASRSSAGLAAFVMDHAYWGPGVRRRPAEGRRSRTPGWPTRSSPSRRGRSRAPPTRSPTGSVVGWYQGRMEFGPRALGNRSILTDPRRAEMKDILNARIKHREPFRPFAPVVLEERDRRVLRRRTTRRRSC